MGDSKSETVREKQSRSMYGTTATVTIEVDDDGILTKEDRQELAIALLEHGMNAPFADWDDNHRVPTVGNRSI